jgi:hypothetical protein
MESHNYRNYTRGIHPNEKKKSFSIISQKKRSITHFTVNGDKIVIKPNVGTTTILSTGVSTLVMLNGDTVVIEPNVGTTTTILSTGVSTLVMLNGDTVVIEPNVSTTTTKLSTGVSTKVYLQLNNLTAVTTPNVGIAFISINNGISQVILYSLIMKGVNETVSPIWISVPAEGGTMTTSNEGITTLIGGNYTFEIIPKTGIHRTIRPNNETLLMKINGDTVETIPGVRETTFIYATGVSTIVNI